jgi:hypothetical protein
MIAKNKRILAAAGIWKILLSRKNAIKIINTKASRTVIIAEK